MDISYNELRNKEIINLADGSKMGHIMDIIFESDTGKINGFLVPGEKRIFKKSDDIFVPIEKIRRIGDDVILIRFEFTEPYGKNMTKLDKKQKVLNKYYPNSVKSENGSFIRYRKLDNKKYK